MNNLLVFPMVLPIMAAVILFFFRSTTVQKWGSAATLAVVIGMNGYLLYRVMNEGILRLDFGGWAPPFGITFVADPFAMLLVLASSMVALLCILYAIYATDQLRERFYLYPFMLFLVAGVSGSFLTGDLFNLFVCFEVMLLASYVLMTLGGEKKQLKEGIIYVLINIFSSWLFLLGVAYVYGTLGTLNFAQMSERIAEIGQPPLMTAISILFLIVFSLKSGLVLYFWLPRSYAALPTAVSALFAALLTKVGVYALFRTFTLIFYHQPEVTHTIIGWMAVITLIGGSLGVLAYKDIRQIAVYNVVIAIGFILIGLAANTTEGMQGAIYYLVHDIFAKAFLFLLIGTIIYVSGKTKWTEASGLMINYPFVGWLFFLMVLTIGGVPPFSGFIGKLLIGQGAVASGNYVLLAAGFISSIFVLYSLLRIFLQMFWGENAIRKLDQKPLSFGMVLPMTVLAVLALVLGLGAGLLEPAVTEAGNVLMNPEIYIEGALTRD